MNPFVRQYNNANDGLNASSFIALKIPTDCNCYLIKNLGSDVIFFRSDINDPLTEDQLIPGAWESLTIAASALTTSHRTVRYHESDTLYFIKGTGPLLGKFWV